MRHLFYCTDRCMSDIYRPIESLLNVHIQLTVERPSVRSAVRTKVYGIQTDARGTDCKGCRYPITICSVGEDLLIGVATTYIHGKGTAYYVLTAEHTWRER